MKPETLLITCLLVVLILGLPRKWVLLPFVMAACIVPTDQRIIIADLDFTTLRFCVLAAMIRLWLNNEIVPTRWNNFDKRRTRRG